MNPDGLGHALPRLEGEGLCLRGLTAADAGALLALFGDHEVIRYTSLRRLEDLEQAVVFITGIHDRFEAGTLYQWGIEMDGEIVGTCSLADIIRAHRRAELGFAVNRRDWGRRVTSRALPPIIDFAFGRLGLHRLEADADPRNEASLRALTRAGFRREGLLRERYHQLGEVQDGVLFGLLKSEWVSPS